MAKNNDLNVKLTTSLTSGLKSLKNVNKSLTDMQRNVNKNSGAMNNMQKSITKMNTKLTNLGKDANRASTGFKGLGKSMNTLNSVMNIGKWYLLANAIKNVVNASMDNIEVVNMFSVALGKLTEKAEETVQALSKVYGLDATNIRSAIGNYSTLARSMGMTNVQAEAMATSTYQLALELSSLYNIPINQVLGDLKSGLVGQSETVYKYGLDVTEAGIKAEAMAQGITKSVRSMSQGEKMALRYNVMLQKSGLSHGDFARTIDQPANQLRILQERFTTLSRSIGNMFIPMLTAILPYANALLKVVIEIVDRLALLLGFEPLKVQNMDTGFGGVAEDIDDQSDALDTATKKAKEYENQLMGFDQLNVLKAPKDTTSSGGDNTGSILGGMDIPRYDVELTGSEKVEGIAGRLRETFKKWKEDTYYLTDSLKALGLFGLQPLIEFASGTFGDFYETILKPLGEWTLGTDGLPKLIYILANDLSKVDLGGLQTSLKSLYESMTPFGSFVLDSAILFYENFLTPIGSWTFGENGGLERLVTIVSDMMNNITWDSLSTSLGNFFTSVSNFATLSGDAFIWLSENILAPLIEFGVNFVLPMGFDLISGILDLLASSISALQPFGEWLFDTILEPMAEWTGQVFIDALGLVKDGLVGISGWISENQTLFTTMVSIVSGFFALFKAVEFGEFVINSGGVIGTLDKMKDSFIKLTSVKLLDKIETLQIVALYVGDFVKNMALGTVAIAKQVAQWVISTATLIAHKVALVAHTVVTTGATVATTAFGVAMNILMSPITLVVGAIALLIAGIVLLVKNWDTVKEVGAKAWEGIKTSWKSASEWFDTKIITPVSKFFSGMWDGLKEGGKEAWKGIKETFGKVTTWFSEVFTKAWDGVKAVFSTGGKIFSGIKEGIETTFKSVVNGIITGVNKILTVPFNAINGMLNTIRGIDIFGFSPFENLWSYNPIDTPQMQYLAKGGVVNDPTLAMVGEAGKEVVMPLENNTGWIRDLAGQISEHGGNGGGMNEDAMYRVMSKAIKDNMGDVILYLDSKEVAKANRKGEAKLGRNFNRVQLI